MILGIGLALTLTRSSTAGGGGLQSAVRQLPLLLLALVVVGLAILALIPARTPPILGENGEPVPGSIASLETVRLGGKEQTIMIRTHRPDRRFCGGRLGPAGNG